MFSFNKIAIITLLACIATSIQADINLKVSATKANEVGVLTQLRSITTKSGDTLYGYTCTVGQNKTASIGCRGGDQVSWPSAQNVELTISCPESGATLSRTIAYAEIDFVVSTQSVACVVSAGGIGQNFIELKVNAWGTLDFNYDAKFYVN